jgi:hypothetical protein
VAPACTNQCERPGRTGHRNAIGIRRIAEVPIGPEQPIDDPAATARQIVSRGRRRLVTGDRPAEFPRARTSPEL